jgi:hypothetical protein
MHGGAKEHMYPTLLSLDFGLCRIVERCFAGGLGFPFQHYPPKTRSLAQTLLMSSDTFLEYLNHSWLGSDVCPASH